MNNSMIHKIDEALRIVEQRRKRRSTDLREINPEARRRMLYGMIVKWVCDLSDEEFARLMIDIQLSRKTAGGESLSLSSRPDA